LPPSLGRWWGEGTRDSFLCEWLGPGDLWVEEGSKHQQVQLRWEWGGRVESGRGDAPRSWSGTPEPWHPAHLRPVLDGVGTQVRIPGLLCDSPALRLTSKRS
jgi:hypothetical protein